MEKLCSLVCVCEINVEFLTRIQLPGTSVIDIKLYQTDLELDTPDSHMHI